MFQSLKPTNLNEIVSGKQKRGSLELKKKLITPFRSHLSESEGRCLSVFVNTLTSRLGGLVDSSLCHRPRNCNLSNLCGRCKSLAPEIVSWSASRNLLRLRRKARCARLSPPVDSRAFGARVRVSRSIFLAPPALVFGSIA